MFIKKWVCRRLYFRVSPLPLNFYTTKVRKKVELCKLFNTFNTLGSRMLKTLIFLCMSEIWLTFAHRNEIKNSIHYD